MTTRTTKATAKFIREQKELISSLGAKLVIGEDSLIDENHKDSIWYAGCIMGMSYKGYGMSMHVLGGTKIIVLDEAKDTEILKYVGIEGAWTDKNARDILKDDKTMDQLSADGRLVRDITNCIEVFVYDESGKEVKHDILNHGDVFKAVADAKSYLPIIDTMIKAKLKGEKHDYSCYVEKDDEVVDAHGNSTCKVVYRKSESALQFVKSRIKSGILSGYVVDEAYADMSDDELLHKIRHGGITITMFFGDQDNWDANFDIVVEQWTIQD